MLRGELIDKLLKTQEVSIEIIKEVAKQYSFVIIIAIIIIIILLLLLLLLLLSSP